MVEVRDVINMLWPGLDTCGVCLGFAKEGNLFRWRDIRSLILQVRHEPLNAHKVFTLFLIVHDMCHIAAFNSLPSTAFVDANLQLWKSIMMDYQHQNQKTRGRHVCMKGRTVVC